MLSPPKKSFISNLEKFEINDDALNSGYNDFLRYDPNTSLVIKVFNESFFEQFQKKNPNIEIEQFSNLFPDTHVKSVYNVSGADYTPDRFRFNNDVMVQYLSQPPNRNGQYASLINVGVTTNNTKSIKKIIRVAKEQIYGDTTGNTSSNNSPLWEEVEYFFNLHEKNVGTTTNLITALMDPHVGPMTTITTLTNLKNTRILDSLKDLRKYAPTYLSYLLLKEKREQRNISYEKTCEGTHNLVDIFNDVKVFKERIAELRTHLKVNQTDQLRQDSSKLLITSYFDTLLNELTSYEDGRGMSQRKNLSTDPTLSKISLGKLEGEGDKKEIVEMIKIDSFLEDDKEINPLVKKSQDQLTITHEVIDYMPADLTKKFFKNKEPKENESSNTSKESSIRGKKTIFELFKNRSHLLDFSEEVLKSINISTDDFDIIKKRMELWHSVQQRNEIDQQLINILIIPDNSDDAAKGRNIQNVTTFKEIDGYFDADQFRVNADGTGDDVVPIKGQFNSFVPLSEFERKNNDIEFPDNTIPNTKGGLIPVNSVTPFHFTVEGTKYLQASTANYTRVAGVPSPVQRDLDILVKSERAIFTLYSSLKQIFKNNTLFDGNSVRSVENSPFSNFLDLFNPGLRLFWNVNNNDSVTTLIIQYADALFGPGVKNFAAGMNEITTSNNWDYKQKIMMILALEAKDKDDYDSSHNVAQLTPSSVEEIEQKLKEVDYDSYDYIKKLFQQINFNLDKDDDFYRNRGNWVLIDCYVSRKTLIRIETEFNDFDSFTIEDPKFLGNPSSGLDINRDITGDVVKKFFKSKKQDRIKKIIKSTLISNLNEKHIDDNSLKSKLSGFHFKSKLRKYRSKSGQISGSHCRRLQHEKRDLNKIKKFSSIYELLTNEKFKEHLLLGDSISIDEELVYIVSLIIGTTNLTEKSFKQIIKFKHSPVKIVKFDMYQCESHDAIRTEKGAQETFIQLPIISPGIENQIPMNHQDKSLVHFYFNGLKPGKTIRYEDILVKDVCFYGTLGYTIVVGYVPRVVPLYETLTSSFKTLEGYTFSDNEFKFDNEHITSSNDFTKNQKKFGGHFISYNLDEYYDGEYREGLSKISKYLIKKLADSRRKKKILYHH